MGGERLREAGAGADRGAQIGEEPRRRRLDVIAEQLQGVVERQAGLQQQREITDQHRHFFGVQAADREVAPPAGPARGGPLLRLQRDIAEVDEMGGSGGDRVRLQLAGDEAPVGVERLVAEDTQLSGSL